MTMVLRAPAKLNLYLKVVGKRPDGYHDIETVFERIAIFDKIGLRSRRDGRIEIFCDSPRVPTGRKSLIYRTIELLKRELGVAAGAEVRIFKRIPIASGLAGGSSDAASVLKGLNRLWKLSLGLPELVKFGKALGADIPFFLSGRSFALARGRGDEIMPLGWGLKLWHLVVSFPVRLLSKDIYALYAKERLSGLTARRRIRRILPAGFRSMKFERIRNFIDNDLEKIVLKKAPIVAKLKDILRRDLFTHSLVSGSGPSVFSVFKERKEAVRAKELLMRRFPVVREKGWQTFVVSTL